MGIDPGLSFSGYSILTYTANGSHLIDYGYYSSATNSPIEKRLSSFYAFFNEKITVHAVTTLSFETPFLGKNAQNFLKLGYLRGLLYLLIDQHHLLYYEFSPCEIKKQLTGFGGADKEQVARVLTKLINNLSGTLKSDITDAIAIGLCGLWKMQSYKNCAK